MSELDYGLFGPRANVEEVEEGTVFALNLMKMASSQ